MQHHHISIKQKNGLETKHCLQSNVHLTIHSGFIFFFFSAEAAEVGVPGVPGEAMEEGAPPIGEL